MGRATDIVHGTIDLLILKTIGMEPIEGWGASKRIHELSHQVIRVREGSLHPALVRLHALGLDPASLGQFRQPDEEALYVNERWPRATAEGTRPLGPPLGRRGCDRAPEVIEG